MNKFVLYGIIVCICLILIFFSCFVVTLYYYLPKPQNIINNPDSNPNLNIIPNPIPKLIPNTIIQNPSDLTTTFLVKTTTIMKGKISDMNIIHNLDLTFKAYKLTKMYTAYITVNPVTTYEYKIVYPDINNMKGNIIYATCDSEEFTKALIPIVIPNSTITIYNTLTKETKQVVATAIEKENVLALYKSYQA